MGDIDSPTGRRNFGRNGLSLPKVLRLIAEKLKDIRSRYCDYREPENSEFIQSKPLLSKCLAEDDLRFGRKGLVCPASNLSHPSHQKLQSSPQHFVPHIA